MTLIAPLNKATFLGVDSKQQSQGFAYHLYAKAKFLGVLLEFVFTFFLLSSCDSSKPESQIELQTQEKAITQNQTQDVTQLVDEFILSAYEQFSKATTEAEKLDQSLSLLLQSPRSDTLEAAKKQWRLTYSAYLKARLYFYLPVADPVEWSKKHIAAKNLAANIDTYPIEGGYIDYLSGYPVSGLVNDLTIELNEQTLIEQHGLADPSYASLGFHVIEFLLWGEQGRRSVADYYHQKNQEALHNMDDSSKGDNNAITQPEFKIQNHLRRRDMLRLVSDKLVKDLRHIKQRWDLSTGYYAGIVKQSEPKKALAGIFQTSQHLLEKELLDQRFQEDSSVFSQTTPDDVLALIESLRSLYRLGSKQTTNDEQDPAKVEGSYLLHLDEQLALSWHKEIDHLLNLVGIWKASQAGSDKAKVIEQTIRVLQLVYNLASKFNVTLEKPKSGNQKDAA